MAITTANLQCNLDSTNAASNTGTGNTWFDLSANNLDFTGTGTSRITFAGIQCFDLGAGKYFDGPNNLSSVVDWDGDWTVEFWFNTSGSQLYDFFTPWGTGTNTSGAGGFNVQSYNPSPQTRSYFSYTGGAYEITPYPAATVNPPRDENTFHQFIVRKSGGTIQYFIDGQPSFSTSGITNPIVLNSDAFYIGYHTFYNAMVGKVSVLRVYDSALTNGEISDNYDTTYLIVNPPAFKIVSTDPASYPGTGNTWFDLSPNNRDWTFNTVPTYNAGYFDYESSITTNYSLTTPYTFPSLTGTNVQSSMEYWIYCDSTINNPNKYRLPFTNDLTNSTSSGFAVVWERPAASGGVQGANIVFSYDSGGSVYISPTYFNALDQWIHIVYVRSGTNLKIYQNGSQVQNVTLSSPNVRASLGSTSGIFTPVENETGFDGKLAQVAGYPKALSAGEVAYLFSLGLPVPPGPPPPPPAYVGLVGGRTFGQGFAG
jgi:hypothetical protein